MEWTRSTSRNVARRSVKLWCDIRGSTVILRSYENTFCTQRKQKYRLYSTICLLRVTVAAFWRVSTERKLHMLFCVSRYFCFLRIQNYGWTSDVTWIILPISLLRFWTLIVLMPLLSVGAIYTFCYIVSCFHGRVRQLSNASKIS